jgi:hypothetical protein
LEGLKRARLASCGLWQRFAATRGDIAIACSSKLVVNHVQLWFENNDADGFNFMAPLCFSFKKGLLRTRYQSAGRAEIWGSCCRKRAE